VVFTKGGREEVEMEEPPTLVNMALYLDVSTDTMTNWAKESEEFFGILMRVKQRYEDLLNKHGLTGKYDPGFAKFLSSADHGKREKSDVTTDGKEMRGVVFLPERK
jgi:hypothetical protein